MEAKAAGGDAPHRTGLMSQLVGFILDRRDDDVILVGRKGAGNRLLTLDDLVVLLRSASIGGLSGPGVSLEPEGGATDSGQLDVVFFGGLAGSGPGKVCFDADYLMKRLALQELPLPAEGPQSYAQLTLERFREQKLDEWDVLSRFWFVPIYAAPAESLEGDTCLLLETKVGVLVQTLKAEVNGKPVAEFHDQPAEAFADTFTLRYGDVAAAYPVFSDLASVMGALKLLGLLLSRAEPGSLDYWTSTYEPSPVSIPERVPLLRKTFAEGGRGLAVVGGVRIAGLTPRLQRGEIAAVRDMVLMARPSLTSASWTVSFDKDWRVDMPGVAPDDRELARLFASGLVAQERGDFGEALEQYDQILALYPGVQEARFARDVCKRDLAVKSGRAQEATDVVQDLRQLVHDLPNLVEARYELGVTLDALGSTDDAIQELGAVAAQRPDFAPVYYALGLAHYRRGNDGDAKVCLERYLAMEQRPASEWSRRAREILSKIEEPSATEGTEAEAWESFTDGAAQVSVEYPKGWRVVSGDDLSRKVLPGLDAAQAVLVAFVHPRDPDSNVNIRITPIASDALTDQDISDAIPQLDKAYGSRFPGFVKVEAGPVTVGGTKGVRYVFRSERAGLALEQCVVTLVKARRAYTVTFTATQTAFDGLYRSCYEWMLNSFRVGAQGG
jgi:tetratricopeptide (TPR) repeat protein